MTRQVAPPLWAAFAVDRLSQQPLQEQIAEYLRIAILSGNLLPGARLPPTRSFAIELSVSRQTLVLAYDRLIMEGYAHGVRGSGIYVTKVLPEDLHLTAGASVLYSDRGKKHAVSALSARGRHLVSLPVTPVKRDPGLLAPGVPALDEFPFEIWARLSARFWRNRPTSEQLGYADPAGFRPLRETIAEHLGATRGLSCEADDILITSGSQHAIDLTVRLLTDVGDVIWVENPGYVAGHSAVDGAGGRVIPVPVDDEGLNVDFGKRLAFDARLAVVTPSHQYPLGVTMSLRRRLELLAWAEQANAWIIEDDCDGDFRYASRPLHPLRALGRQSAVSRVIYVGTFAKVLAPGLRLGFLVAPPGLSEAFTRARALFDRQSPTPLQMVLADFIGEGYFSTHLRRMRALYAERRNALISGLSRFCADDLDWGRTAPDAGLHLVARLRHASTSDADMRVWHVANSLGLQTPPLSPHYRSNPQSGLVIGFGATHSNNMIKAVRRLKSALDTAGI